MSIAHAWVNTAQSVGDTFGWTSQGIVDCLPTTAVPEAGKWTDLLQDPDAFKNLPPSPPASAVIDAQPSKPLASTTCAKPFQDATIVNQAQPIMPDVAWQEQYAPAGTTYITVAIDADADCPMSGWMHLR